MAYTRPLPTPVFGVSTIAERARPEGFAEKQINMRSDVQDKLVRRPKTKASMALLPESLIDYTTVDTEVFYKDGVRYEIVIYSDNIADELEVFYRKGGNTFTRKTLNVGSAWLAGIGDLGVNLIDSDFYIWNRNNRIETEDVPALDASLYKKTSLVNIVSALNYAETVTLKLVTGATEQSVSWSVPGLTADNQEEADEKRATNRVAQELAALIDVLTDFTAVQEGSNIVVTYAGADDLIIEVSSGRGDGTVEVFNHEIASIDFLPKFCLPYVVRTVKQNPRSNQGTYYLQATPVDESATDVTEVIWTETRAPSGAQKFKDKSFIVKVDTELNTMTEFTFKEQLVGDSDSNPALDFVGEKIEHIEVFQDRLTILAGSRVSFSKTGDYRQMWKGSATETLVSDPTSVGTNGNSSTLKFALYHNRDLLIFSNNAQFKLPGSEALTPQTAAMPRTTSNECDLTVSPVQMGSHVYYAITYGNSVGIRRFEVQENTSVDQSVSITEHVVGLMAGSIIELVSNANQDLLIVRSSESDSESFHVFELQRVGDEVIYSWSEWRLASGMVINKLDIYNEVLTIRYNDRHYVTCNLREAEDFPTNAVCLDQYIELLGSGTQATLPVEWSDLGTPVVLLGDDGREQLIELYPDKTGSTLEFGEDVDGKKLLVGYKYESIYQPSRLFKRDRDGNIQTRDRLRLVHFLLELSNTYRLTRSILSDYWDVPDDVITGLNGFNAEYIDDVRPYNGLWQTSIGMNTTDCQVVFKDDSPYTSNIVSISYTAQLYSTTSRR